MKNKLIFQYPYEQCLALCLELSIKKNENKINLSFCLFHWAGISWLWLREWSS